MALVIEGMGLAAPHLNSNAPRLEPSALSVTPEKRKAYLEKYKAEFRPSNPRLDGPPPPLPSSDSLSFE